MRPSKRGRPPEGDAPKQSIALRLDRDVLAAFKAQGPGWQSRMQETLKRAASRLTKKPATARKRGWSPGDTHAREPAGTLGAVGAVRV